MTTLLVTPEELASGQVEVRGDAHHHLFVVRRLAAGETVRLVDGAGRARLARVERVEKRQARLRVEGSAVADGPVAGSSEPSAGLEASLEPSRELTLLVAALRPERAAWLVEKATELGAVAIRFLATSRTPRQLAAGGRERLRRVAVAALEQCGRARLPEVSGVHAWSELAGLLAAIPERLVLDLDGQPLVSPAGSGAVAPPVAVLVGPEGGWSDAERRELRELGARPLTLGRRVLRVETAALAATARLLLD